ncbi:TonB-dependent receptor [Lampropedia puyangensis]|uniref:TonB-dependent receptor n=2 Tax=Lampropedia puyangensis TaxID=1330072 RepID=A0A4S8F8P7_9BURK|nr:TonB-dependent receptor [Lampropedia puyangensis]
MAMLATAATAQTGVQTSSAANKIDADQDLHEIFVTATSRPEERSRIAATTQVIDRASIERSSAQSITDLLAENAVGFFSEWTAAQTSINLRGAATDGQGRDFRSQVLVLVNGRRAGTANISKLSPSDVDRIEIVRGPSSVVYGSQNMGGVINIIMKRGYNAQGNHVQLRGGSWGLYQAQAQTGGTNDRLDWYLGVNAGGRDSYESGYGSHMSNTSWERRGVAGALGLQLNNEHRIDLNVRTDGIFNAGFRGSGANEISKDNRSNRSLDAVYEGQTQSGQASWMVHAYRVTDIDEFNWASPVVRSGTSAVPGTKRDYNHRQLDATGVRLQPRFELSDNNHLLLGLDWERSKLRSEREREALPGGPTGQVAPYDNNQTERVHALYFEDAHNLLDDRLTLRAGLRKTWGKTHFDPTPNLALQQASSRSYDAQTWSIGAVFKATEDVNVRATASTGFRAPTATELAADFTAVGGGRTFGNASLKPERSRQIEVGATWQRADWRLDGALFQNTISDRIITISRGPNTNTSDYGNNSADIVARGLELNAQLGLKQALGWQASAPNVSLFGNAYYHFEMKDKGASAAVNTNKVQRMYRYEVSSGVRYGQGTEGKTGAWNVQLAALLRGPMWYDTEEALLIPQGESSSTFIHRKGAFTVWNLRGSYRLNKGVELFAGVNNLFDKNQHPIFIAIDQGANCIADSRFQNGGCGTSMPGRELFAGIKASF